MEVKPDKDAELRDVVEFAENDLASDAEEMREFEQENDKESDEFSVNCTNYDREIEFGWEQPNCDLALTYRSRTFIPVSSYKLLFL